MKCTETARIMLPWGGKLLSYCPVHANQILILAEAIGNTIQVKKLPPFPKIECESNEELSEEEKGMNDAFNLITAKD